MSRGRASRKRAKSAIVARASRRRRCLARTIKNAPSPDDGSDVVGPPEPARVPEGEAGDKPRLGGYVLLERVGAGGAGVVHRAWQHSLQRFVALKIVHEVDPIDAQRFTREAHMAATTWR
jgi:serine/threonine protein kinase